MGQHALFRPDTTPAEPCRDVILSGEGTTTNHTRKHHEQTYIDGSSALA